MKNKENRKDWLVGERVCLRPITTEDTEDILRWRNSESVKRYFIYQEPFTREGHLRWLENMIGSGKGFQFIVCRKNDLKPIGSVYLRDYDPKCRKAEYGIFIGEEEERGRGTGTECLKLILEFAAGDLKLHKIFARVFADNLPSLNCFLKCGFTKEAYLKEEEFVNGEYRDIILLSRILSETEKTQSEWAEKKKVSFVIPCYKSSETIGKVVEEIKTAMKALRQYSYEIILVNDCSPDATFDVIKGLCRENDNICGINLAKNFGQHGALMAGFHQVKGDILVCLDDDGQTPADEVGKLLAKIEEGDDVVYASYAHKQHSLFRNMGSYVNEKMAQFLLGKPKELYVSSYFAARRFVVDEMLRYENAYPYVIGLVLRSTRKISNVPVEHRQREVGRSGYTLGKLIALWFNGFTAFSTKPLRIATVSGCIFALFGFAYGSYTIVKKFINPAVPLGFSSMMSAVMFIGGMVMLMLGLIGEYIGRMYICMNNAPQFVIRDLIETKE